CPALAEAVQRHVDSGHARELRVLPCRLSVSADGDPSTDQPSAAFVVEQFEGPLPPSTALLAPVLAEHTAVAVARARDAEPLAAVRRRAGMAGGGGGRRRALLAAGLLAAITLSAAALAFVPAELRIAAEGRLVPAERSRIFAPVDATVARVLVGHADAVRAGQPLVELRSETLEIELERAEESLATTRQEITALETARLRAGLPGAAATADVSAVTSRLASLRERTGYQRRRVELLRDQRAGLVVVSPIDGRVMSWRPGDYLADRPVRRGERLMEVAAVGSRPEAETKTQTRTATPTDAAPTWVIEIDVPDRRAGHLLAAAAKAEAAGQPLLVDFVMKSAPAVARSGRVTGVASITQANAVGEPVVRVAVEPVEPVEPAVGPLVDNAQAAAPRGGSTVLAKIRCGERSLGYVWFHQAWEAVQRVWF
ncbi:MAG: biotin/lipoyl-binding protein, partial [Planctomycetota bacterium]